jgi:23S rRNA (cytosine1962-C5)-methyltransferase
MKTRLTQPDRPLPGTSNERPARRAPAANRLAESAPVILEAAPDRNYALVDSGNGRKLERYGPYLIERPEGQALWRPALPESEWRKTDAIFTGDTEEDGMGRWRFPKTPLGETWPLDWDGISYLGRFTSFRHVGVFPEQSTHWRFIEESIGRVKHPVRMLNLFGYTGLASLVAARAGAHVTHVDASKKAIGWARENQQLAGMEAKPIRWICDDAVKFCEREVRRNSKYEAIVLDPPSYGRGPKGEVWQLFEDLPRMLDLVREMMSDRPLFIILTAYSIRASFFALHEIMQETLGDSRGRLESGELVIRTEGSARKLSTSLFSRWIAP